MPKVQITVEATGLIDIEMTEEQIAELEARADDLPIDLDDVRGVVMDEVLNGLDFELSDFHVVRPRRTQEGAKTEEDLCPCECHPNSEGTIASCVHCVPPGI